jgi:hypothetical protein
MKVNQWIAMQISWHDSIRCNLSNQGTALDFADETVSMRPE